MKANKSRSKRYEIILADPPWKYNSRANHKTKFRGGADGHYDLMTTNAICQLPIQELAADNAILFLWATFPMLPDAFKVIEAWGFEYKTVAFLWVKENATQEQIQQYEYIDLLLRNRPSREPLSTGYPLKALWGEGSPFFGVGYYTKSNPEVCLLATRCKKGGSVMKPERNDVSNLIIAPRRKHSQKPWEAHFRIEAMYPNTKKVELFARDKRHGWNSWGNEIESDLSLTMEGLKE